MYVFFADEADTHPGSGEVEFWVYGGMAVPAQHVPSVDRALTKAKADHNIPHSTLLKFNSKPSNVSRDDWRGACTDVLSAARELGCLCFATVVHHEIAKHSKKEKETIPMCRNATLSALNKCMSEKDDFAMAVIDRLDTVTDFKQIDTLRQRGFEIPNGTRVRLDRISGYSLSSLKAFPSLSLADYVVGAFRTCINQKADSKVRQETLRLITPLFWARPNTAGKRMIPNFGLQLRPLKRLKQYDERYQALCQELQSIYESA